MAVVGLLSLHASEQENSENALPAAGEIYNDAHAPVGLVGRGLQRRTVTWNSPRKSTLPSF